jgi:hypothetical protein
VKAQANVELAGGVPFISDADLQAALDRARVSEETATAVLEANQQARLDGLRTALVCSRASRCLPYLPRGASPPSNRAQPPGQRAA